MQRHNQKRCHRVTGIHASLIGDVENGVRKGGVVCFQRKGCWSLHDGPVDDEPLRIGAWIAHQHIVFIHNYCAVIFRLIRAVSFERYEFVGAFSINDNASRAAGYIHPARWYREVEEVGLVNVDGNVYRHIGYAIGVAVATTGSENQQSKEYKAIAKHEAKIECLENTFARSAGDVFFQIKGFEISNVLEVFRVECLHSQCMHHFGTRKKWQDASATID